MIKFNPTIINNNEGEYGNKLEILEYNKFRGGFLNRQIIMLLLTLGVKDEAFIELQEEYLKLIM